MSITVHLEHAGDQPSCSDGCWQAGIAGCSWWAVVLIRPLSFFFFFFFGVFHGQYYNEPFGCTGVPV